MQKLSTRQRTLAAAVSFAGYGVHSAQPVTLTISPGGPDAGITICRLKGDGTTTQPVPVHFSRVTRTTLCTTLDLGDSVSVATVEHVMSALSGMGVDNALITLDGGECPILDGSSRPFAEAILGVGLEIQPAQRRFIKVMRAVTVRNNDAFAALEPYNGRALDLEIDFDSKVIGRQRMIFDWTPRRYYEDVSRARTFGFVRDAKILRQAGYALGSSLDNSILGATYDPSLTGTIRVSVVATGTDATMVQALEPAKPHASRTPLEVRRHVPVEPTRTQIERAAIVTPAAPQAIEHQVEAAVAEAFSLSSYTPAQHHVEDDGVFVEPYIPAAESLHESEESVSVADEPVPSVYVPSHAARPEGQRRMPRTEELPIVARRSHEPQERHEVEPRNARALFKKLASNVGLNLGQSQPVSRDETHYSAADDAAARSAIEAGGARTSRVAPAVEGARGNLDAQGRQPAPAPQKDSLEIPAFLRKHG